MSLRHPINNEWRNGWIRAALPELLSWSLTLPLFTDSCTGQSQAGCCSSQRWGIPCVNTGSMVQLRGKNLSGWRSASGRQTASKMWRCSFKSKLCKLCLSSDHPLKLHVRVKLESCYPKRDILFSIWGSVITPCQHEHWMVVPNNASKDSFAHDPTSHVLF